MLEAAKIRLSPKGESSGAPLDTAIETVADADTDTSQDSASGDSSALGLDLDTLLGDAFEEAFAALPTLSIGIEVDDMFAKKDGIYQHTQQDGPEWERPASAEFIFVGDESDKSFSINCGIRIQGGSSRNPDIPKHSFSLRFRQEYGAGKLEYPLFREAPVGETAVRRFDFLQLRSGFNFAWPYTHE